MKLTEYVEYDGLGLAELVRKGEVTSSELTKAAFDAMDAVNRILKGMISGEKGA